MCVEKPDGDLRLCIDPQELNKYLIRDFYEIPKVEDVRMKIASKKFFAVIDIRSGFHHFVLDEDLANFVHSVHHMGVIGIYVHHLVSIIYLRCLAKE